MIEILDSQDSRVSDYSLLKAKEVYEKLDRFDFKNPKEHLDKTNSLCHENNIGLGDIIFYEQLCTKYGKPNNKIRNN